VVNSHWENFLFKKTRNDGHDDLPDKRQWDPRWFVGLFGFDASNNEGLVK